MPKVTGKYQSLDRHVPVTYPDTYLSPEDAAHGLSGSLSLVTT
jgi:hypothetical protein